MERLPQHDVDEEAMMEMPATTTLADSPSGIDTTDFERIRRLPPSTSSTGSGNNSPEKIVWNFTLLSILFSANHGCVVACLGLATARLGSTGAWQSGIL